MNFLQRCAAAAVACLLATSAIAQPITVADVKYDATLPPLPADARAALDRVAERREYARFRLELLAGRAAGSA